MSKAERIVAVIGIALFASGFALVAAHSDWRVAVGVAVMLWGSQASGRVYRREKQQ